MSSSASDAADTRVRFAIDSETATVTLCCPERRNAQTPVTWAALRQFAAELPADVRVVVIRGEGPSFSAGLDRKVLTAGGVPDAPSILDLAALPLADAEREAAKFQEAFTWLARPGIVSIAAVQGHAVGAGFQLALACDLRVATDDASFTMPETSLGLVPDLGGTRTLPRLVGYARALDLCLTGRSVAADEALSMGLVNQVVAARELDTAVADLAARVLNAPEGSTRKTKALLVEGDRRPFAEQLTEERRAQWRRLRELTGRAPS